MYGANLHSCKVDGLTRIFENDNDKGVVLEFMNAEKMKAAAEKIMSIAHCTNNYLAALNYPRAAADKLMPLDISSYSVKPPEASQHRFSCIAKQMGTVGTPMSSAHELTERLCRILAREGVTKNVPIVKFDNAKNSTDNN